MGFERTPHRGELNEDQKSPVTQARENCAAGTDPGCERETNEDRYLVTQSSFGMGYFVFDGMGGAPGGAAAAQVSSDAINDFFAHSKASDAATTIRASIEFAQGRLLEARTGPGRATMGTTVVGVCVSGAEVAIGAVGDSRAYRVNDDCIQQLTSDHTIVQQLVDSGHLAPQEALMHPQSHVLTRCLGSEISFKIDCLKFWLWPTELGEKQDHLLLCSDGLYSLVTDEEMRTIVTSMTSEDAIDKLIQLARERGGFDNITVLIKPLGGTLRNKPLREDQEGSLLNGKDSRTVARPENQMGAATASIMGFLQKSDFRANVWRHLKNVVLLGVLGGFVSIVLAVILMVLKG